MKKRTARFSKGHEERFRVECSVLKLAKKDEKSGQRRFKVLANTGTPVSRTWGQMVIDLEGLMRGENMGMLLEHKDDAPAAVSDAYEITKRGIELEGYLLDTPAGLEIATLADQGWPWKASVGVRFDEIEEIPEDEDVEVNGKKLKGPITVVRKGRLFETSFIYVNPADLDTEAAVMRARAQESIPMAEKNDATPPTPAPNGNSPAAAVAASAGISLAEARKIVLAEIEAKKTALTEAFPKQPKFVARMISEGKTLDEAKEIDRLRAKKKVSKLKVEARERTAVLASIPGYEGFDPSKAEILSDAGGVTGSKLEDRVRVEVGKDNRLAALWGDESDKALLALLKHQNRQSTSGKNLFTGNPTTALSIDRMAHDFLMHARALGGAAAERLGIGKVGPDLGRITIKGFIGSYYNAYEEAMSPSAFQKLSYQLQSDQEAEIVRWLEAPPQLQEWKGARIAKDLPIRTQLLQSKLYEATLKVSKWDFQHQKFDLINKSFGQWGGVSLQHWDQIYTVLLESNPTAYDTLSYFSRLHTLGGDSGMMSNDLTSGQGFVSLAIADPTLPTQIEAARILFQCTPHARTFAWANGIKMNGQARRWGVMVHPNFEGIFYGAMSSDRLDTGQSNPLAGQKNQFELIVNPYLTLPQYVYLFRLDTPNSPFLKAEPEPIQMLWQGPGSHFEFVEHAFAMGLESVRGIAPGAWESAMRLTLGAAA